MHQDTRSARVEKDADVAAHVLAMTLQIGDSTVANRCILHLPV